MVLEAGLLGKLFGSAINAPTNIAGLTLCLLVLIVFGVLVSRPSDFVAQILEQLSPIITLILGYVFGRRS